MPGKSLIAIMCWSRLCDTLKNALARHQGLLPLLEGAREAPRTSSQRPTEMPEVSTAPVDAPQPHTLTAAERRRQISRTNRLVRYEQIVALHSQGLSQRMIARHLHVSRKVVRRSVTAGAFPERAPTGRRQSQRGSLPALSAQALGGGLSQWPPTRARAPSPRISRIRLAGPSSHWRMESMLAWPTGAGARQETTGGCTRQAPSVTPARLLVVCQRPGAAHGRPAGAH